MKLADWLDEYRALPAEEDARPTTAAEDDWEEQDLLAPADRVRDTSPRWLRRVERVRHARDANL